ncbi:MAG: sugar kinase [Rhizobiaceae bacterium]
MNLTATKTFLSIGECMVEFSGDGANGWRQGFAGDTLNTAWYFRMQAGEDWDVAYYTRLGTDGFSNRMIAFMEANGVSTRHVTRDPERTPGLYVIETHDGERSFTYWREMSAARRLADDPAHLAGAIAGADVVYLSGITLAILAPERRAALLAAVAAARGAGKSVAFDPNIRPRLWENACTMRETIMKAAATATIVLPSFDDEAAAFGDASPAASAQRYLDAGASEVAVKNGGGPIHLASASGETELSGLKRTAPVDTTGAGDSFNGAYLAARLAGDDREQAARSAHRLAAAVVRHRGALMPMR